MEEMSSIFKNSPLIKELMKLSEEYRYSEFEIKNKETGEIVHRGKIDNDSIVSLIEWDSVINNGEMVTPDFNYVETYTDDGECILVAELKDN